MWAGSACESPRSDQRFTFLQNDLYPKCTHHFAMGAFSAFLAINEISNLPVIYTLYSSIPNGSGVIRKFADAFKHLTGSAFALAMTIGTAMLHSAYFRHGGAGKRSSLARIYMACHGDASSAMRRYLGFCHIDPFTLTADPTDIERRITERTRAIQCCPRLGGILPTWTVLCQFHHN